MKKFYIVANPDKENTKNMQAAIEKYLKAHGAGVSLGKSVSGHGNPYTDPEEVPADTECVITLGGDGTLIQAARDLAGRNLPMIGINLGGLGYLTQIGREGDVKELLDALLEDSYQIQERMMLKGCVYRDGRPVKESIALNDIVLTREGNLRIVQFNVYVNGTLLNTYQADGVIICTPTGSTGYNLSAGGPVVEPTASLIVITPICSHALNTSSVVLSAEDDVEVEICEGRYGRQEKVALCYDGAVQRQLVSGDRVKIRKSDAKAHLVKLSEESFMITMREKMKGN